MIVTTETEQVVYNEFQVRNPHQKRALKLIESDNLRERMMGFALVSTCFHLCELEIQDFIEKKWKLEKNLVEIKKEFVSFCSDKFRRRQF
ncbi:MAG: hypothetical protein ACTSQF_03785 [Candidatus Heimdallarchaeaceae archaeon]